MEQEVRYPLSDNLKRIIAGENETVFRMVEDRFSVIVHSRLSGLRIEAKGDKADLQGALSMLDQVKIAAKNGTFISPHFLSGLAEKSPNETPFIPQEVILRNKTGIPVVAKTASQAELLKACEKNDVIFADGPAGTGKTFLAVAIAVASLEQREVERICLVRPAVEAGESLGYLPGDLKEKIAPYLRPIQDSLAELLPAEKLRKYQESGQIEVAPLAYMRGRTLKHAFIILDEAQNTTIPQMQMFLTRLGSHSKAIITGDSSQIDLGPKQTSGFAHAIRLLSKVKGIAHIRFPATDVLRHPLVREIIKAYESGDRK
ncbi:phosphate starvation-inducible protein PhoH [Fibrobacter intestinalis]|uniref:PhoH-like protein n=1 Tax=Fibrobacter intestinalis TaxID=28122 RepID=A0A1M6WQH5_9BACT|nr:MULTISPECIES: PhoH family protein [Fibrobacter]MDD7298407.1 PhoH family protein [Fibrobacter intestinalis]PBC68004.1 phosphate starvation-inducible protein PhoH [Fibrobacter sp. UWS1]SHK95993.1 phosphate starvation-inducible protein PhoH [Fibrobacter intestinalis]